MKLDAIEKKLAHLESGFYSGRITRLWAVGYAQGNMQRLG